ncbi:S-layer homology domain-containing protein [Gracilibacillus ureilyticus]|uniref:S-layer homology domain-containing protein n=1 Tax=Gracilibacillus ureilyticus TaxID=531814 RepID=A0A1H9MUU3_9BACI|nr:S-layer homology domain-containing protein [Gracilibacillus ureilyticus]SER27175.1 S-layer homology domain-containing protein [Gracilibacillus ureilyticus]
MGRTSKKSKKIFASTMTAAVVASVVAPTTGFAASNFTDVQADNFYYDYVTALSEAGIIHGKPDGSFDLYGAVKRSEAAKMIAGIIGLDTESAPSADFTDVKEDFWYTDSINALYAAELIHGVSETEFAPDASLTRAQFAKLVVDAYELEIDENAEVPFTDLEEGAWYEKYVKTLYANELIAGTTLTTFSPDKPVKRADFAKLLTDTDWKLGTTLEKPNAEETVAVESVVAIDDMTIEVTFVNGEVVEVTLEEALVDGENEVTFTVEGVEYTETVNYEVPALEITSVSAIDDMTIEVIFDNGEVVEVTLEEALVDGKNEVTFTVDGVEYTETVNYVNSEVPAPEVASVSAINANEVKVEFNTEVLESLTETISNYTFETEAPAVASTITPTDIQLQEDGKTAIVRFADGDLVNSTTYKVTVENVLTTDHEEVSKFEDTFLFSGDNKAASLKTAKVEGSDLLLTFDEEVDVTNAVLKVDGVTVSVAAATEPTNAGEYAYKVDVTGLAALEKGTHNLTLVGVVDFAGNESNTLTTSYTVNEDTTAPTIDKIEAVDNDTFKVTFSESVTQPSVKVLKGTTEFAATPVEAGPAKEYTFDVAATAGDNDLYAEDEETVNLSVEISNYKDGVNLYGDTVEQSVTLSQDTDGPVLLNSSLNTVEESTGNTVVTVPFKGDDVTVADTTKVKVIDPDGIELTPATVHETNAVPTDDSSEVAVTVTGTPKEGTYTVVFEAGAIIDGNSNDNDKITTTADFSAEESYLTFGGTITPGTNNAIEVDFGVEVSSTALNVDNYKLDNAALPEGSTVVYTDASKEIVEVRLPESFVVVSDADYKFEITQDVKTAAGDIIVADQTADTKTNHAENITLTDNVSPELVSAQFAVDSTDDSTSDSIVLTFSEEISLNGGNDLSDDLVLKVGSNEVDLSAVAGTVAGNELTITIPEMNISQTTTITIVSEGSENEAVEITDASAGSNAVIPTTINVNGVVVVVTP